jgi:S1-C subfamily serine protease
MSQDRGNEGAGKGDTSGDSSSQPQPGLSYDMFGNQLMPAAPDSVRAPEPPRGSADRSNANAFGAPPSSAPASSQQQPQRSGTPVSPVTYAIAGVAGLALVAGGFFLVKNMMGKSGTPTVVAVTDSTKDATKDATAKDGSTKTAVPASDSNLSANEVFKKCMPSVVMITVHYGGTCLLNDAINLSGLDGEPIVITADENDKLTFYDDDDKPTKSILGLATIDGKKFGARVTINGTKGSVELLNLDGTPVLIGGHPAVVTKGFELVKNKDGARGSGFFVRPDIVATNRHVVSNQTLGAHAFGSGVAEVTDKPAKYEVIDKPIYVDAYHDLALLYVPGTDAKPLTLHTDVSDLKVGDPVYALGSPKGFSGSISEGVISSDRLREDERRPHGERFHIQHTAKIDHGNSGGPLVNARGEVLGVDTLGIGTAVFLSVSAKKIEEILEKPEVIKKIAELQKNSGSDLGNKP